MQRYFSVGCRREGRAYLPPQMDSPFAHVQWAPSAELAHATFLPVLSSDGVAMSLREHRQLRMGGGSLRKKIRKMI